MRINNFIHRVPMLLTRLRYPFVKNYVEQLNIQSVEETMHQIISNKMSLCRFGDGEFKWLFGINFDSFENTSDTLSENLGNILKNASKKNVLIGLPDAFRGMNDFKTKSRHFWQYFIVKYHKNLSYYLSKNVVYYNANISRFYMDYKDLEIIKKRFNLIKKLWNKRKILLVEGQKSKNGIGNDLFDNAESIRRIICPSKNAFESYDKIKKAIIENVDDDEIVLLSLGPTATLLAYDLATAQRQVVDFGQIDVEYEWFKKRATSKVALTGKFVNEVDTDSTRVDEVTSLQYEKEVIQRIDV